MKCRKELFEKVDIGVRETANAKAARATAKFASKKHVKRNEIKRWESLLRIILFTKVAYFCPGTGFHRGITMIKGHIKLNLHGQTGKPFTSRFN